MTNKTVHMDSCPSELTCAIYADGELIGNEAVEFEDHLGICPRCQDLVHAFQMERNALVGVLGNVEAFAGEGYPLPAFAPSPAQAAKLMGLVLVFAALLRMGLGLLLGYELPWSIAWLNPLHVSGQLSLLFSSGMYFIQEGGWIMELLISSVGLAALGILLISTSFILLRRSFGVTMVLGSLSLILITGFTTRAEAIEIRTEEIVSIESDETIDDTLVAFSRTVRIDGVVTGDLIVFAQSIEIRGAVRGDVFTFGQNMEIDGQVGGGIAGFGQVIRLGSTVGQSVFWFGQSILSRRETSIEGDLYAFGEDANVGGSIGRNVTAFTNNLTITGDVKRDVTFGGRFAAIHSTASIGGNLDVELPSGENLQMDSAASVAGVTNVDVAESGEDESLSVWPFLFMAIWLAAAFASGMMLFWLFPALGRMSLVDIRAILVSAGTGFLILITMPIAAVVLCVTLIGLPAGLVTAAAWALGLYVSKIVVAHFLGTALLRPKQQNLRSMALPLLVGLVLVLIVVSLPYVGWIINLLLVILGLGAMGLILFRTVKDRAITA